MANFVLYVKENTRTKEKINPSHLTKKILITSYYKSQWKYFCGLTDFKSILDRYLWQCEVTTVFCQEVLSASKCSRLQAWTVFIKTWGILWYTKIEIHFEFPFLKKSKSFYRALRPVLGLVIWSLVPLWVSSSWENKATHIFQKLFFQSLPSNVYTFTCIYKPVLP